MRKKVRGLRALEQAVLPQPRAETPAASSRAAGSAAAESASSANRVVLEYCAAVRGIGNDDQGGPLQPPGPRMAEALSEVRQSIQRNLDEKKGDRRVAT